MKRVFLSYLWKMDPETLAEYSKEFATSLMPAIYPQLRQKLETHRAAGHFLILASASPEFYVSEIGRELGFDLTLGTVVETGPFFPDLENHKGRAKVDRLFATLPGSWFENGKLHHCHGYTDSTADLPMLTLCAAATVVNPARGLANIATASGWEIVRPTRPWKSKLGLFIRTLALLTGVGDDPGGLKARS